MIFVISYKSKQYIAPTETFLHELIFKIYFKARLKFFSGFVFFLDMFAKTGCLALNSLASFL